MAAPSIAALYRNSEAPSSAKQSSFSLDDLKRVIHYSGAPHTTRALTIAALQARGPWPNQDGPATAILCISLKGMMLEGGVCKRTVQRRIKRACDLGFWRRTREANSWSECPKCSTTRGDARCGKCGYRGSSRNKGEFTRPYTYEFNLQKFIAAPRCREIHSAEWRTYAEYKAAAAARPNVTEMPARKPAQAEPPPAPQPPKPAAEHAHRGVTRADPTPQPKLTKRECAKLAADIASLMMGCTHYVETLSGYSTDLDPSDPRYRPRLGFRDALAAVAKTWQREQDVVADAFKFWGYSFPSDE
jgi:cell division septation protein DedD